MSVERNFVSARFEKHFRALQALVNANVERMVTLADAMSKVEKLLESGLSINRSDYSVKISKLTREVQRLAGHVESKDLELQTMP